MNTFDNTLRKYAELILKNGINLQKGQDLLISINTDLAYFAEMLTEVCYKELKSGTVHVQWSNDRITRSKYEYAADEVMNYIPDYSVERMRELSEKGAAVLSIVSANPDLLSGIDSQRIADAAKLSSEKFNPFRKYREDGSVPWCIAAASSKIWGKKVFPELDDVEAEAKLWEYIFKATRADLDDPVKAWDEHVANLKAKSNWLTEMNFKQLHYVADGTDLFVGLVKNHKWVSAAFPVKSGYTNIVNVPTEEVFSVPDKFGVNGTLKSTMPLNIRGNLIEDFSFVFENGKVVDYDARVGKEALGLLLDTDDGAKHLGEVALVPYNSPIQNLNTLFYNTLFDENASCHFAIGNAIIKAVDGAIGMSKEELAENNINDSLIHVDFMVGAKDLSITGIKEDGTEVPVFVNGNWA